MLNCEHNKLHLRWDTHTDLYTTGISHATESKISGECDQMQ